MTARQRRRFENLGEMLTTCERRLRRFDAVLTSIRHQLAVGDGVVPIRLLDRLAGVAMGLDVSLQDLADLGDQMQRETAAAAEQAGT